MNREKELEEQLLKTIRALKIATERAVSNGDRLIELGEQDFNRGQFLSLIDNTIDATAELIGKSANEIEYLSWRK